MSHLSITPFILPRRGISLALTITQLSDVLMTLTTYRLRAHIQLHLKWRRTLPQTDRKAKRGWERQTAVWIQVITYLWTVHLSPTWAGWSWDPAFVQSGHMCPLGSLGCPYSHVLWRKSTRIKQRKSRCEKSSWETSVMREKQNKCSSTLSLEIIMIFNLSLNWSWMI